MTAVKEIYYCPACGNIVEVVNGGLGGLHCCGKPMVKMTANTVDAAVEKHVPIVEPTENGILVKVGSVEHPMDEDHYIQWIEVSSDARVMRAYLKPGMKPQAEFTCPCKCTHINSVRAYCNKHGLWKKD